jgi:imidazolonepropionase-like amidohydrolase
MDKIALTNVRVFDGERLLEPATVVVDGGRIASGRIGNDRIGNDRIGNDQVAATTVEGDGRVLLPGLIDCHIHLTDEATLSALARQGVTTGLDMGTWPPELVASLRNRPGVTDVRSSGTGATHPDSAHAKRMGRAQGLVANPDEARAYVSQRIAEGVDYIKIIVDLPGFDEATVRALAEAAHARGLRTIAHAAARDAVLLAQAAGVDVLTHAPIDRQLEAGEVERTLTAGQVVVPTLTMMEAIVEKIGAFAPVSYDVARSTVGQWHRAGVPILAGTDANQAPSAPASPPYGTSLHHELGLLVDAGLSPLDALRSATAVAADYFGLSDRGVIAAGKRADLVLIDGDPLQDISAVSKIAAVWCAGVPVSNAPVTGAPTADRPAADTPAARTEDEA